MIDLDTIRSFRVTLEDEFVQNSIFAPEPDAQDPGADTSARLYADAYSGSTQLSVSGKSPGSVTVTAIGVGGDYFLFHPLQLLSGGYVSDRGLYGRPRRARRADGPQPLRQQRRGRGWK